MITSNARQKHSIFSKGTLNAIKMANSNYINTSNNKAKAAWEVIKSTQHTPHIDSPYTGNLNSTILYDFFANITKTYPNIH